VGASQPADVLNAGLCYIPQCFVQHLATCDVNSTAYACGHCADCGGGSPCALHSQACTDLSITVQSKVSAI
jgi:hypothetical protein